jgi:hypothetical protein
MPPGRRPISLLVTLVVGVACTGELAAAAGATSPLGPAGLTIYAVPARSAAGQQVEVAGRAPGLGPRTRVTLWEWLANRPSFRPVATTVTTADGEYAFSRAPTTNSAWYVTALRFRSTTVRDSVTALITLEAIGAGQTMRFAGLVSPSHAGEPIALERKSGVRWRLFARPLLSPGSAFLTATPVSVPIDVRAVLGGGPVNARSVSPEVKAVSVTLGGASAMAPNYFGLNWDYGGASMFPGNLASEYADLAALRPGTLRWPGGTEANYFQWQSGYPTDFGVLNGFDDSLPDLAAAYQATGASPVFDLNVMTSDVSSQEQMLFAAQRLGLPVKYVELGNELYGDAYSAQVPSATSYGETVAKYVVALHNDFPGVLVAAAGASGSGSARFDVWNYEMLTTAAEAGGSPDAIALHTKPWWLGPLVPSELRKLFGEPSLVAQQANATIAALPYPLPAWITEYNLWPETATNPVHNTFAQALLVAEDSLMMRTVPDATLLDYWRSFSGSRNSAYVPSSIGTPALTPAGLALEWIGTAATGATTSAPITFSSPALRGHGPSALIGYQFSGGRDVIVNVSPLPLVAPAGAAIPSGVPYQQVSADPVAKVTYASDLRVTDGTVRGTLTLPPYSLTLVG